MWEKKAIKDKNEKLHLGNCQGKAATFGNNAKFGIHYTPKVLKKKKGPQGNHSTASANPSIEKTPKYDSESDNQNKDA